MLKPTETMPQAKVWLGGPRLLKGKNLYYSDLTLEYFIWSPSIMRRYHYALPGDCTLFRVIIPARV